MRASLCAAVLLAMALASPAGAQPAVGEDFQVNTLTTGNQSYPSVAAAGDGSFIVVWDSDVSPGDDTDGTSVRARAFSAAGVPLGSDFEVNTTTSDSKREVRIAGNESGEYVVVWTRPRGSTSAVVARQLAADGSPVGQQFVVAWGHDTTWSRAANSLPSSAVSPSGSFVVCWAINGWDFYGPYYGAFRKVAVRRYAADGTTLGGGTVWGSAGDMGTSAPAVAAGPAGDFVVAWSVDDAYSGIRAKHYDDAGSVIGQAVVVDGEIGNLDVAVLDDSFVVTWDSAVPAPGGTDTSGLSVKARLFASDGTPLGERFQVNTTTTWGQLRPKVAIDPEYGFAIVWDGLSSAGPDTDPSIAAQSFDWQGNPIGGEVQLNSFTYSVQDFPDIDKGVAAWQSYFSAGGDSDPYSVQGQLWRSWRHRDLGAWWRAEGNGEDASVNGNDGTLLGAWQVTSGAKDEGLWFDGATGWMSVPNAPSLNVGSGDFTIAFWLRTNQRSGTASILDKRSTIYGYQVFMTDGRMGIELLTGGVPTSFVAAEPRLADGRFHFAVVIVDRDEVDGGSFWVDGQLALTFDPNLYPGSPLDNGYTLLLGRRSDLFGGGQYFDGVLDEVCLWHRAFTSPEVAALWRSGDLRAWWQGEGDAADASGNGNLGQLVGGVAFVPAVFGFGLSFDGSSGAVEVPHATSLNLGSGDYSISLWVQTSQSSSWVSVLDKRSVENGYQVMLAQGRPVAKLLHAGASTDFICPSSIADGQFHFVAVTVDRTNPNGGNLWVDGQLCLSFDPTPHEGSLDNHEPLLLGRRSDAWGGELYFGGVLDDVRLYSHALAAEEVNALYLAGGERLFSDGFETGDTSRWFTTVP